MKREHLTILGTTVLLAISVVGAGVAQAATNIGFGTNTPGIAASLEPGAPLSPMSEEQAVRKAQDYLNYDAFSRQGLIRQLVEAEGFSTADATSAVDSLTVDWNEQAARKAQDYLNYDAFSHEGLLTQLVQAEGFTPAQAEYGVTTAGL